MNWDEYEKWVKYLGEWGAEYHKTLRNRPVRAQTKPGDIAQQLEKSAPETGTDALAASTLFRVFPRKRQPTVHVGGYYYIYDGCAVHVVANLTCGNRNGNSGH
jgi:hypothetical protein